MVLALGSSFSFMWWFRWPVGGSLGRNVLVDNKRLTHYPTPIISMAKWLFFEWIRTHITKQHASEIESYILDRTCPNQNIFFILRCLNVFFFTNWYYKFVCANWWKDLANLHKILHLYVPDKLYHLYLQLKVSNKIKN